MALLTNDDASTILQPQPVGPRTLLSTDAKGAPTGAQTMQATQTPTMAAGTPPAPTPTGMENLAGAMVKPEETTEGRITGLLDKDSIYLQQARAAGERQANARGLLNTTMGVQAGESARIQAALPIAQTDAAIHAERAGQVLQGGVNQQLQLDQFGYNSRLSGQEHLQRLEQLAAEGDIQARLEATRYHFTSLLQDDAQKHDLKLEDSRFQNSLGYLAAQFANTLKLSDVEQRNVLERLNVEHQLNLDKIGEQYGQELQSQYLAQSAQLQLMTLQGLQQVYSEPGLTAAQQQNAAQYLWDQMRSSVELLGNYYSGADNWTWEAPTNMLPPGSRLANPPPPGGPSQPPGVGAEPPRTPSRQEIEQEQGAQLLERIRRNMAGLAL